MSEREPLFTITTDVAVSDFAAAVLNIGDFIVETISPILGIDVEDERWANLDPFEVAFRCARALDRMLPTPADSHLSADRLATRDEATP